MKQPEALGVDSVCHGTERNRQNVPRISTCILLQGFAYTAIQQINRFIVVLFYCICANPMKNLSVYWLLAIRPAPYMQSLLHRAGNCLGVMGLSDQRTVTNRSACVAAVFARYYQQSMHSCSCWPSDVLFAHCRLSAYKAFPVKILAKSAFFGTIKPAKNSLIFFIAEFLFCCLIYQFLLCQLTNVPICNRHANAVRCDNESTIRYGIEPLPILPISFQYR